MSIPKTDSLVFSKASKSIRISSDDFLPLELTTNHHICLWSSDGSHKWTIGYFDKITNENPFFKFVSDRPFDERVCWFRLKKLIKLGYDIIHCHQDITEHQWTIGKE